MSEGENSGHNAISYDAWAESMEKCFDDKVAKWHTTRTRLCSIYRVPHKIRAVDEDAYEPQMLSIGPYHRSNPKLQAMEGHKWRYLRAILRRNPKMKLCNYLEAMKMMEGDIRSFYSERKEIDDINSKAFVEMMLLDACFLVQLFLNEVSEPSYNQKGEDAAAEKSNDPSSNQKGKDAASKKFNEHSSNQAGEDAAGSINDPIYSINCILPIISMDMLLLENQLPFFVLQRIFEFVVKSSSTSISLVSLAVKFFRYFNHNEEKEIKKEILELDPISHLLHLYHSQILPATVDHPITVERIHSPLHFPSATEMFHSGIRLMRSSDTSSILEVEFNIDDEAGVLKIPHLCINYSTNSLFRNMIAWEQCHPMCPNYFTSYAIFMDGLINSTSDVALLKKRGIIQHCLGSDEDVCLLFNKLRIGIPSNFERNSFSTISHRVNLVRERRWTQWRAELVTQYFKDAWNTVNFQLTLIAIVFTIVQTVLAVLSYKRSS